MSVRTIVTINQTTPVHVTARVTPSAEFTCMKNKTTGAAFSNTSTRGKSFKASGE